jgi:leucyl/phenylalanyl-tRNA--protein transferase
MARRESADPDPLPLTPDILLGAYAQGVFPMAEPETGDILWFSPDPRAIIPLDEFRIRRSLRRVVRSGPFTIRSDTAFEQVMRACAEPRPGGEQETWISPELIAAYVRLHQLGFAHSVEAWLADDDGGERLVGGLYGVAIRRAFFGESMFHHADRGGTDASKVCLVHLVHHLRRQGYVLLDTQFWTEHLAQFGCVEISRRAYLRRLAVALGAEARWQPFRVDPRGATA